MSLTDDDNPFDFGADEKLEELTGVTVTPRTAIVRTSDRMNFKRCRRRWHWSSHMRQNLAPREAASPLWYGSGFHFAMEDFHGLRQYPHPIAAFEAYVKATYGQAKGSNRALPTDWPELVALGRGMLGYYADTWLVVRDPLKTFIWEGKPQVEVNALVPLPINHPSYDQVLYACTLDRVTEDDNGDLWILDYKTAKRIQTQFFQTNLCLLLDWKSVIRKTNTGFHIPAAQERCPCGSSHSRHRSSLHSSGAAHHASSLSTMSAQSLRKCGTSPRSKHRLSQLA